MTSVLIESAVFARPEKVKVTSSTGGDKVIFDAILQEAELKNQNKRVYPKSVLQDGLQRIANKINKRAFLGELDHPISTNQIRQTTVLYKNVSHIIREVGWDGNLLRATLESTPYSEAGRILGGLILDKVAVGFSLRGLADVQDNGQHQIVMAPLIMIGYDSVSDPSNNKALVQEVRMESVKVIYESTNVVGTSDGHCYLNDYFDELVERKLITLQKKYW